jgi:hypothetical protein
MGLGGFNADPFLLLEFNGVIPSGYVAFMLLYPSATRLPPAPGSTTATPPPAPGSPAALPSQRVGQAPVAAYGGLVLEVLEIGVYQVLVKTIESGRDGFQ